MLEAFLWLKSELVTAFSLHGVVHLVKTGNYGSLLSWEGISAILLPIAPALIIIELLVTAARKHFTSVAYKVPFLVYLFNYVSGRFIYLGVMLFCIAKFSPYAPFTVPNTWYWFIYGYIAFEFAHFTAHYLSHKIRLFWCLHSTHHAPEKMNLLVSYSHFILELPYAEFIKISICILAGIPPIMLFVILAIDGLWGFFIHIGEDCIKDGRFGFLGKFILTPSHHRVHHAKNPLYIDTNFCNLLPIWDRVFRTYQPQEPDVAIEYGITRKVNTRSFLDVYFGELYYLWKDVVSAPGVMNKLRYIIMPPGWCHLGEHKTASAKRAEYLKMSSSNRLDCELLAPE